MFVNQASTHDLFVGNPGKHFLGLSTGVGVGGDSARSISQCCSSNLELSQQTDSQDLFSQTQKTELPESDLYNSNYQKYVSESSLFGKTSKFASKTLVLKGLNVEDSCDVTDLKTQMKQMDERKLLYNIQETVGDASSSLTNIVQTLRAIVESYSKKSEHQVVAEHKCALGITQLSQELKSISNLLEEHGIQLHSQHAKCLENKEFIKHAINSLEKLMIENNAKSMELMRKLLNNEEKYTTSLLSEIKSLQMNIKREVEKQMEDRLSGFFQSWGKRCEEYEKKIENDMNELKKYFDILQPKNCSSLNKRETHSSSRTDVKETPCKIWMNSSVGYPVSQFSDNCIASSVQQHYGSKSVIMSIDNPNENHSPNCEYKKLYESSYDDRDDELGIFSKTSCLSVMSMKRRLHKHFSNKSNTSVACTELQNSVNTKWNNKPECKLLLVSDRCNDDNGKVSSHFNSLALRRKRNHLSSNTVKEDICEKRRKNFRNSKTLGSCSTSVEKCDEIADKCSSNRKCQYSRNFNNNMAATKENSILSEVIISDSNNSPEMLSSYDSSPCMSVQNFASSHIVPQNATFRVQRLYDEKIHTASLNSVSNALEKIWV